MDFDKIKIVNVLSMIGVVAIHASFEDSYNFELNTNLLPKLISSLSESIATSIFFFISGYLFFYSLDKNDSIRHIGVKLRKRMKTYGFPYIFWNLYFFGCITILGYYGLAKSNYFTFERDSLITALSFLFFKPAAFHLWFLRNLIVFTLTTPIIYFAITKFSHKVWLIFLCFFILLLPNPWSWSFLWYYLGCIGGYNKYKLFKISSRFCLLLFLCFFISLILKNIYFQDNLYFRILNTFLGFLFIVSFVNRIARNKFIINISSFIYEFSFFTYCFHEPLINVFKRGFSIVFNNMNSYFMPYFLSILCTIFVTISFGWLGKKYFKSIYMIITGNR